jgi:dihydropyrimidinase
MYHFGVRMGRLTLAQWVRAVALEPAQLFGLYPMKGTLMPGSDADVVIFDPQRRKRLDAHSLHQATDYSPHADTEICGWPRHVLQRGRFLIRDEAFVGRPGAGKFVPRRRFRTSSLRT